MDKIVTDPLYLKCKRMVETCNKNQTEMAQKYLELAVDKILKRVPVLSKDFIDLVFQLKKYFRPLRDKLEELNG
jgi:hypothetical protein